MYNYANAFRCATKVGATEFMIQFLQENPRYGENNEITENDSEIVASVVMDYNGAKALKSVIDEAFLKLEQQEK